VLESLTAIAPRFADMPFIFLTALSARDHELKGRTLGADAYVTKPIDFERLAMIISLYPDILLEVSLLDRPVDLMSEGFDMAVVPSNFSDPNSLIARSLMKRSIKLFASPTYAAATQLPSSPQQLVEQALKTFDTNAEVP
jgi:DNA-binding transcriptional LysR family regulator